MVDFKGPAFEHVDNRLMSLELVQAGLTGAAMFTADGRVVQPSDVLYKKCILIERGSFRPATKVTVDMLHGAQAQFVQEPGVEGGDVEVLFEMALHNLREEHSDRIDAQDFLERADALATLGKTVLVSNYSEYHRLAAYLHRHTRQLVGIVMGVPTLRELFNEKYYADLDGGILESFGRLFKNDLKIYVYPQQDAKTGSLVSAGQHAGRAAPPTPLRISRRESADRRHPRLRRVVSADLLARRAGAAAARRLVVGDDDTAVGGSPREGTAAVRVSRAGTGGVGKAGRQKAERRSSGTRDAASP